MPPKRGYTKPVVKRVKKRGKTTGKKPKRGY
jgi:hypothetical protein